MEKNEHPHETVSVSSEYLATLAIRFAGKLLLRNEIYLDDATFSSLLLRGHFKEVPSIQHHLFYSICSRCHNRKRSLMGSIPCKKCNRTHLYCRHCIQM